MHVISPSRQLKRSILQMLCNIYITKHTQCPVAGCCTHGTWTPAPAAAQASGYRQDPDKPGKSLHSSAWLQSTGVSDALTANATML
jgi:hypothetical protein